MLYTNLQQLRKSENPIQVLLPNGTVMESTHEGLYPGLDDLPEKARLVHVFPKLTSGALMSVPQLCDHGCTVVFNVKKALL